jgi:serine/threonine protein kinase
VYVLDQGEGREGGMASILRVRPAGVAVDTSFSEPGTLLALKLARADEPMSVDALNHEAEVFVTLRSAQGMPPCPRLHDIVSLPDSASLPGSPSMPERERAVGLVMEWCPLDMERWWSEVYPKPWAFAELCDALSEVCLRLREYQATCAAATSQRVAHSDVKPRNLLRAQDARWLLTDFGASKARDLDGGDWSATRVILGTESFIAPEGLFNARKSHPEAMDIWSVGATLYALLRMRAYLQAGNKMPLNGTHSTHFRSHRVALVSDLHQRKPALFIDKPLDPTQFTSPTRLPDKDRVAVAECLRGCFATPEHEVAVVEATLAVLDRAMQIDPQARYADAAEMALALADLARLGRVDDKMDATRVSVLTADGLVEALSEPAPDITGERHRRAPTGTSPT